MIWLAILGMILIAVILAGRAHSRFLDRAEARAQLLITPLSTVGLPIANTPTGVVPLAVVMGERLLIYSAPADQTNAIFKTRDGCGQIASADEVADLPSASYGRAKPIVRDAFRLQTSRKAS
jgi:hypothetical protein